MEDKRSEKINVIELLQTLMTVGALCFDTQFKFLKLSV